MSTTGRSSGRALAVRVIVSAIAVTLWFGTQSLISKRSPPPSGIGDALHVLSAPLNQYLHGHPIATAALLIVSSGLIDLMALYVLAEWVFGRSVRPLLGLFILIGLRQIMQALCALPTPDSMIWRYPGFPSLLVTYNVANDYFFSGHTAIAVFAATELARLHRRWLTAAAIVVVVFEVTTVLVLRAHYTMDIFGGTVAALYVASLSERISPALDRRLARIGPPIDPA